MAPKAELREFLKSRRDWLQPEDVGLPSGGGLIHEYELAAA